MNSKETEHNSENAHARAFGRLARCCLCFGFAECHKMVFAFNTNLVMAGAFSESFTQEAKNNSIDELEDADESENEKASKKLRGFGKFGV